MCHFMFLSPLQRDSTQKHVKNLDVVLGADTSVLILDDTEGVWPQHVANLIQVDRYIFFPACATRFGRSHKCLLEKGQDEDADKGMLSTALQVMQQVHTTLFQVRLDLSTLPGTGVGHYSTRHLMRESASTDSCNLITNSVNMSYHVCVYMMPSGNEVVIYTATFTTKPVAVTRPNCAGY